MKIIFATLLLIVLCACNEDGEYTSRAAVTAGGETIGKRIDVPEGFEWIAEEEGSFGYFLQNSPLKAHGSPILDFTNEPISNQSEHVAVLDYDIGNKDLQQCADAVIRLRAEYLYKHQKFDDIAFHFTNGDLFKWNDYKEGIRPRLYGNNRVEFEKVAAADDSYAAFRKYLDIVFMYAGTISLNRETVAVRHNDRIQTGDIIITPGSPGHVVIIVGRAKNRQGKIIYLLAQGYTPAQSIHVISNPFNSELNPWYELDVENSPTVTARYTFTKTNIRSFD